MQKENYDIPAIRYYPTVSATTGSGDIFYYTIFQLVEYPLLNLKRMVMQLYT
ncbi:hypothetical protein FACI_IFERC00001G1805 [Ferroplasma acidarmanus Fer1]|uniref:Uncharacterized protein n=1 Tax=Ferroplasma acidarmanus Fer1 TaxID=333146 RepID=S0ARH3_FERAC|nr:hypothetical protein FACI_IFERC00001G1805 [Ferroplasma acidarmanus Fer1]